MGVPVGRYPAIISRIRSPSPVSVGSPGAPRVAPQTAAPPSSYQALFAQSLSVTPVESGEKTSPFTLQPPPVLQPTALDQRLSLGQVGPVVPATQQPTLMSSTAPPLILDIMQARQPP